MNCKRAFVVCLTGLLFALGWSGQWSDLGAKLQKAADADVVGLAETAGPRDDPQFNALLPADDATKKERKAAVAKIRGYVALRATYEGAAKSTDASSIQAIKQSSLYRKAAAPDTSENWLGKALDRIRTPDINLNEPRVVTPDGGAAAAVLAVVMWSILGATVILLAVLAIRAFTLSRNAKRQSSAMLEDDEPERPLDEWLQLADQLEREGRFREAVRCLYVACLLRFDEARIARFDRTHTNWEHFRRITASPATPRDFDFRTPTRDFDRIWYGHAFSDAGDVQRFRTTYTTLAAVLKSGAAA